MTQPLGRRVFLQAGAATALGVALSRPSAAQASPDRSSPLAIQEPAREIPIVDATDVVVCGAGPAGVAAAIAAARTGASVRLIENHGQLGGIWTTGLLSWVIDANNKGGIMEEITQRIAKRVDAVGGVRWERRGSMPYDVEQMKLVLEQLCVESGVKVRLHTRVAAAVKDGARLTHCVTESKSGREAFAAKAFIDCTGDGDLAALAGCGFDFGRPAEGPGAATPERTGETQPFSLMMLITGIDSQATADFYEREGRTWAAPKAALMAEFKRAGMESSYGWPTVFKIHDDLYAWMINHEYGFRGIDAQHVTDATLRARGELHQLVDGLRSLGDPWKNIKIVATASQIGVREGRRVHGRHTVSIQDMLDGAHYPDAICRVTFGIDVHSTNPEHSTGIESHSAPRRTRAYDIPMRALIAKDADGLLMAGRCISGDFLAHSSYRVTGNAVAMGEAAGTAASMAAAQGRLPHEVAWEDIAEHLPAAAS